MYIIMACKKTENNKKNKNLLNYVTQWTYIISLVRLSSRQDENNLQISLLTEVSIGDKKELLDLWKDRERKETWKEKRGQRSDK